MVDGSGQPGDPAVSRDLVLDGERRFDLRTTVAWIDGIGLSLWAYYGQEAMEIPKRTFHRMLHANSDHPFVKFALADDDRPMLMTELPTAGLSRDELGRGLARLTIVADRLLDETLPAVADRGILPDWSGRVGRNCSPPSAASGLCNAARTAVLASAPLCVRRALRGTGNPQPARTSSPSPRP